MVDQEKKTMLEQEFAGNFASDLFPDLVNIYIEEGNYKRARTVCEIGLSYHPEHRYGLFLLAQIVLGEKDLDGAEKLLQALMILDEKNAKAAHLLVTIQERLSRPPEILRQGWRYLLELDPGNQQARVFLKRLGEDIHEPVEPESELPVVEDKSEPELPAEEEPATMPEPEPPVIEEKPEPDLPAEEEPALVTEPEPELPVVEEKPEPDLPVEEEPAPVTEPESELSPTEDQTVDEKSETEPAAIEEDTPAEEDPETPEVAPEKEPEPVKAQPTISAPPMKGIKARMATFTLVAVLKDQGLYHQALEVLEVLEQKGSDQDRVNSERDAINQLIQSMSEEQES